MFGVEHAHESEAGSAVEVDDAPPGLVHRCERSIAQSGAERGRCRGPSALAIRPSLDETPARGGGPAIHSAGVMDIERDNFSSYGNSTRFVSGR